MSNQFTYQAGWPTILQYGRGSGSPEAAAAIEAEPTFTQAEAKQVTGHLFTQDGKTHYNILFTDGTTDMVPEEECNCEPLISEYLHGLQPPVNTVYIFCRVSTKAQAVSLGVQARIMLRFTREDQRFSGFRTKVVDASASASAYLNIPTDLRIIGESAQDGDYILFYRVNRLSHNVVASLEWLEDLTRRRVRVYSLVDNLSYDQNKFEFVHRIVEAQKESAMITAHI
jgi:hypothetical protein